MSNSTRISLFLSNNMLVALRAAADREQRDQSRIIRAALAQYLGVEDRVVRGGYRESKSDREPAGTR